MCGRYNVTDSPEIQALMGQLGLPGVKPAPQHNVPPGGIGEFVIETAGDRYLLEGIWSLLIDPRPEGHGYRPNPKFHTFNARSDRLTSSPLWKKAYPSKRCIVPVSAFHEWKGKQVYNIHPENEATALAGLWQSWHFENEAVNSFTVITKNLRAVQLLLGHTNMSSTVRYLGVEVEDALEIAESIEI